MKPHTLITTTNPGMTLGEGEIHQYVNVLDAANTFAEAPKP
jgi:hypothetical protein